MKRKGGNAENLIRLRNKFYFQKLNAVLLRHRNITVEQSEILSRYKALEVRKNPLL